MNDFDKFIKLVSSTKDYSLLEDFLVAITTSSERRKLVQRVEIIKRLINGDSHHQIASDLGVGVATVTRGYKELSQGRFKILNTKSKAKQ